MSVETLSTDGAENDREIRLCSYCRTQWRYTEDQTVGSRLIYTNEATNADAKQFLGSFAVSGHRDLTLLNKAASICTME